MDSYLLHDANAGNNFKMMIMMQKEGMKGYGIYWMLLEFLRLQDGYKADLRVLPDRKSTRLNSSHANESRMPSSA